MEKEALRASDSNGNNTTTTINSSNPRDRSAVDGSSRPSADPPNNNKPTTSSSSCDFVLQWGSRKRLRFMKVQVKDVAASPLHKTTVRRVVRTDYKDASTHLNGVAGKSNLANCNGYFNLRQRPSASPPPPPHRVLRNTDTSAVMRAQNGNCGIRGVTSPEREKRGAANHYINGNNENNNKSSETANDSKKGGCSSGSGGDAAPVVWPPKLLITLTNKEKEEDFYAFKGTKLPQRPKKRAKFIQRTVNLVSPGQWLCDLTLERYEVREKKTSKKRPRGLKAMNNMESDSE